MVATIDARWRRGTALALFLGTPAYASAQNMAATQAATGAGQPTSAALDQDIVVTAQKREQVLIDVPLSITAISGETLARRGASAIEDVQYSVPGLSITQFSPGQQRVQLRGISVFSGLPTVGVYQDEMPLNLESNQTGQDVRLLDIDRVEVLRGPQGTLYGQGAVGGTIRYITNPVDLDRFSASAAGEVAGIDSGGTDWRTEGTINVPLVTDQLGARIVGSYQHFGGWIDNPALGLRNTNAGHALTLRGKLAMVFSDAFKLDLTVQHQDLEVGGQSLSDDDQNVAYAARVPFSSRVTLANAIATYDFGGVSLLSSTGYLDRRDRQDSDLTAVFGPFLPLFGVPAGTVTSVVASSVAKYDIFTQEVRLSSNGDRRFGWTIGGFYRNSDNAADTSTTVTPNVFPGALLYAINGTNPAESRSWAVFGEANLKVVPTLTALVGLRYFHDRRTQQSTSTVFGATANDAGQGTFHALSPRFNLSWQPDANLNIYANVARGFRSGGFNVTSVGAGLGTVPPSFDPDTMWSYEVGTKFQTDDRRLFLELAGYRNEWGHVQTTTNLPGLPTSFTTNGGKLAGWGIDGSVNFLPVRALTLTLTGGWNDMAYKSNSAEHLDGDRADYVPHFTGSASAEYRATAFGLPSFVRVDYQYSARFQVFLRNFQAAPVKTDVQSILNARVGTSDRNWSASLFVRNLLNRYSVIYPAFGSLLYPARLQPRTAGVSFSIAY